MKWAFENINAVRSSQSVVSAARVNMQHTSRRVTRNSSYASQNTLVADRC
jgi:hypothetical protein